ncbi:hypothetical protein U9M48_004652, partial [Paspalum notatum var. saurae]
MRGRPTTLEGRPATPWPPGHRPTSTTDQEHLQIWLVVPPGDSGRLRNANKDARNIRFALSTDGMNPFSEMSSSHSTWHPSSMVVVKWKFIMMPALIQAPKQLGNGIDVYLQPLVEELLLLWTSEGVRMWDAHKQEAFDLRALLFVTINDRPALANLSRQTNKDLGHEGCVYGRPLSVSWWQTPSKEKRQTFQWEGKKL